MPREHGELLRALKLNATSQIGIKLLLLLPQHWRPA